MLERKGELLAGARSTNIDGGIARLSIRARVS